MASTVNDIDKLEAFEMTCYRRMLRISWMEHRTNESVLNEVGIDRELVASCKETEIATLLAHDQSTEPLHTYL